MADTSYFRSPTKQELRQQKLDRKEASRRKQHALGALAGVLRGDGVYQETEEEQLITDIPTDFLPKQRKQKKNTAESALKRECTNPAYVADIKSRPQAAEPKRPVVAADRPLPLSWEATHHGKNDTSAVQSKLAYTKGQGEVPDVYHPNPENPRKKIEEARKAREAMKVPPREKKAEPFVYQPKVTKLKPGEVPSIVDTVPTTAAVEKKRPSTAGIHAKSFR